jgi:acetoin utilization protein AcuB
MKAARLPSTVSEIMVAHPRTMGPNTTVAEAFSNMVDGGFRHVPIVERGRLVGVLSDRDVLKHMPPPSTEKTALAAHGKFAALAVREIMTTPGLTVGVNDPLDVAIEMMILNQVGALVVTDAARSVRGVVTLIDVAKAYRAALGAR